MSDKYEELAKEYLTDNEALKKRWDAEPCDMFQRWANAFRWLDEKCEKDREDDLTCAYFAGVEAGKDKRSAEFKPPGKHCFNCGRRIVEREG